MTAFEEQYEDVLQNIEFAIVSLYREHPEMTDWSVEEALDGLTRAYVAEQRGRPALRLRLDALQQELYERIRSMCEWRLGREQLVLADSKAASAAKLQEPKTPDEIIACLKRVRLSVKRWNKEGGRRGYLTFVSQFVG
jgi:hypothetical protein